VKKFIIAVAVVAAIAVVAIALLHLTVPKTSRGVRFPLTSDQTALLAFVPPSVRMFALVPTASAVYGKLEANPMTSDAIAKWAQDHRLPQPWLMGGADLLVWSAGEGASYAIRLDPFRAALVRIYLMFAGDMGARWSGSTLLVNTPANSPAAAPDLSSVMSLAAGLPAGDALVVQLDGDRSAFPPTRRPAVTSIRITTTDINLTTRAPADPAAVTKPIALRNAHSAMLSAAFSSPPRVIEDLNRIFLMRVTPLVSDGGGVVIYDVDTGTLLPRPKGVIIMPPDDARREALASLVHDSAGLVHSDEQSGELLMAFDASSIGRYRSDTFDPSRLQGNLWVLHLDPERLVPVLERVGDSTGLRLAAGRLYRSARQLGTWIGPLSQADSIEAASSAAAGTEEMRVVIASK